MVDSESTNPIVIAMEEIAAGKVNVIVPTAEQVEAAERERRGLGPIERPAPSPVSELLKIEPEEEEAEVAAILGIEELEELGEDEEDEEEEDDEEVETLESLLENPGGNDEEEKEEE